MQIFFAEFLGFAAGIYVPMLMAQRFRPNKSFDDYRIAVNMLLVAIIMLLCGILAGRRRFWLGLGFSIGSTLSLVIMGLGALVFTYLYRVGFWTAPL